MRLFLALLAPLLMASVAPSSPQPSAHNDVATPLAGKDRANCRGKVEAVRDERGLPKLQRDNAAPSEPLFIAAVDKRIDGCEVLVMRENTSDVRPLPEFQDGEPKLIP